MQIFIQKQAFDKLMSLSHNNYSFAFPLGAEILDGVSETMALTVCLLLVFSGPRSFYNQNGTVAGNWIN